MNKRPTIKDIAAKAGVSMGTVHIALNGKTGVSNETRKKIQKIALEIGYKPNHIATSLKRKALRIATVLPVQTNTNRYYFSFHWDGVNDYFNSMQDFNIETFSAPYHGSHIVPPEILDTVRKDLKPDGLICEGFTNALGVAAIKRFNKDGIPVVMLGSDIPNCQPLCSVIPSYKITGEIMAEQLLNCCKDEGAFIIGSGDASIAAHRPVTEGFHAYMQSKNPTRDLIFIPEDSTQGTEEKFITQLEKGHIAGCCAVTARDSVSLARALKKTNKAGAIPAIGSDVFPESIQFLKDGTFCNLIQKNPYQQAFLAAQYLTEYLIQGKFPPEEVIEIGSEVVFKSSLPLYDNGFYRLLT